MARFFEHGYSVFSLCGSIQQYLISWIEESLGGLSPKEAEFVRVAEVAAVDSFMGKYGWRGNGRKPYYRKGLLLAFMAKAVWNFPTTRALMDYLGASQTLRRLCGWERAIDIPSEATFSRAFGQLSVSFASASDTTALGPFWHGKPFQTNQSSCPLFALLGLSVFLIAEDGLPCLLHGAMVKRHMEGMMACHMSTDSTAIEARERPAKKPAKKQRYKERSAENEDN